MLAVIFFDTVLVGVRFYLRDYLIADTKSSLSGVLKSTYEHFHRSPAYILNISQKKDLLDSINNHCVGNNVVNLSEEVSYVYGVQQYFKEILCEKKIVKTSTENIDLKTCKRYIYDPFSEDKDEYFLHGDRTEYSVRIANLYKRGAPLFIFDCASRGLDKELNLVMIDGNIVVSDRGGMK